MILMSIDGWLLSAPFFGYVTHLCLSKIFFHLFSCEWISAAETEPVQPKEVTDQLLIRGPVDFLRLTKFGHIRLDSDNPARWETEEVPESQDQYGFIDQSFFGTTGRI